jgi:hypothetical protein
MCKFLIFVKEIFLVEILVNFLNLETQLQHSSNFLVSAKDEYSYVN